MFVGDNSVFGRHPESATVKQALCWDKFSRDRGSTLKPHDLPFLKTISGVQKLRRVRNTYLYSRQLYDVGRQARAIHNQQIVQSHVLPAIPSHRDNTSQTDFQMENERSNSDNRDMKEDMDLEYDVFTKRRSSARKWSTAKTITHFHRKSRGSRSEGRRLTMEAIELLDDLESDEEVLEEEKELSVLTLWKKRRNKGKTLPSNVLRPSSQLWRRPRVPALQAADYELLKSEQRELSIPSDTSADSNLSPTPSEIVRPVVLTPERPTADSYTQDVMLDETSVINTVDNVCRHHTFKPYVDAKTGVGGEFYRDLRNFPLLLCAVPRRISSDNSNTPDDRSCQQTPDISPAITRSSLQPTPEVQPAVT